MTVFQCASSQAGIAVSNIPLEGKNYKILGPAETRVSWVSLDFGILAFPLETPPIDRAMKQIMAKKGGNALINLRFSTYRAIYLFFTIHTFHLKADVVKLAEAKEAKKENQ